MYSLSDICSLCLIPNQNLKSFISRDTDGIVVEEKLKVFLLEIIHFKPDIPKYICSKCLLNADNIFKFRLKCLVNLTSLNEKIQTVEGDESNKNLSATKPDINIKDEDVLENVAIEIEEEDRKYEIEDPVDLKDQNNSERYGRESKIQRNCSQSNIALESVFIKEEPSDESYNFNENTNMMEDVFQMEITESHEMSLENTTSTNNTAATITSKPPPTTRAMKLEVSHQDLEAAVTSLSQKPADDDDTPSPFPHQQQQLVARKVEALLDSGVPLGRLSKLLQQLRPRKSSWKGRTRYRLPSRRWVTIPARSRDNSNSE